MKAIFLNILFAVLFFGLFGIVGSIELEDAMRERSSHPYLIVMSDR